MGYAYEQMLVRSVEEATARAEAAEAEVRRLTDHAETLNSQLQRMVDRWEKQNATIHRLIKASSKLLMQFNERGVELDAKDAQLAKARERAINGIRDTDDPGAELAAMFADAAIAAMMGGAK